MAIRIGILSKKYESSYPDNLDASDAYVSDHEPATAVLTEEEYAFLVVLDGFITDLPEILDVMPHQKISAYPESHQSAMEQIFRYRSEIFKKWNRNQGLING